MAERRMFCKTIIDGDDFLDLAPSARLLYYDLGMRADDDGFINAPKRIIRSIGASAEDLNALVDAGFLLRFPSGVVAIRHWKTHNYIRKDVYKETICREEKEQLSVDPIGAYVLGSVDETVTEPSRTCNEAVDETVTEPLRTCNETVDETVTVPSTQVRLGKDRLGKDSIVQDREGQPSLGEESVSLHMRPSGGHTPSDPSGDVVEIVEETGGGQGGFVPPTYREVAGYCLMNRMSINPKRFYDYYSARGWLMGKTPMKNWQAALESWATNGQEPKSDKEVFQQALALCEKGELL